MNRFLTLLILLMSYMTVTTAQVVVHLESPSNIDKACYTIALTNQGGDLFLEGQNFRLYYNSAISELSSVQSLLSIDYYTDAVVKQDFKHIDATGFGPLSFENHLGFINFYIDHKADQGRGNLIKADTKLDIAQLCFDEPLDMSSDIIWADQYITQNYATAFNQISLVSKDDYSVLSGTEINYVISGEKDNKDFNAISSLSYYPNPFAEDLNIDFNEALTEEATISVNTLFGEQVSTMTVPQGSTQITLSGAALQPGAYMVTVETTSGSYRKDIKALKIK